MLGLPDFFSQDFPEVSKLIESAEALHAMAISRLIEQAVKRPLTIIADLEKQIEQLQKEKKLLANDLREAQAKLARPKGKGGKPIKTTITRDESDALGQELLREANPTKKRKE